ncbi:MAG: hypothetical protein Q7J54_00310 [Candidatus Woesearchaeota archaeon]|nr:hypothetical protein [Candidatus Woesearchaeota archaeon]
MDKEVMKEIKIKETQGMRKIKQYFEDLQRNKHFLKFLRQLKRAYAKSLSTGPEEEKERLIFDKLMKNRTEFEELIKELCEANPRQKIDDIINYFAERYGISEETVFHLFKLHRPLEEISEKGIIDIKTSWYEDMCFISDSYDEQLNPVERPDIYPSVPIEIDKRRQRHIMIYPISIDIHRFASKRDILDFIENRWEVIEDKLNVYTDEKKKRFRKRKYDRKLLDFIWENKELKSRELIELLNKEFPNHGLVYFEVSKLIQLEKNRRNRDLIEGQ